MDRIFKKVEAGIENIFGDEKHSHAHPSSTCDDLHGEHTDNRYHSFAPPSSGRAKWYVDGASYFWAVSEALEQARESIYILDWWLSPELYLRRPPSRNERYRVDNMLLAAAERGVKVHIIVYKEVQAALTLDSQHTRRHLEGLHPNIGVFRHPDHTPTGYDIASELGTSWNHLTNFDLAKASGDAIKALYGTTDGMVLFWAHHEKLLVVDGRLGFMGGLDMCFGRWDTNSHPIADAHPGDLDAIIFPGQDYNNARVFDFADVGNWNQNKLDRTKSSRMGWSDVALSMDGPIVDSLVAHFVDRWNFIWKEKYKGKDGTKYAPLPSGLTTIRRGGSSQREEDEDNYLEHMGHKLSRGMNRLMSMDDGYDDDRGGRRGGHDRGYDDDRRMPRIQLTRSACEWSSGHAVEHSIANAYVDAITNAEHFIYIENQFFITATDNKQHPVSNKLGLAIVNRILRARDEDRPFRVWVVMPAVPAFAGDLQSDGALGTRAIMEFQYNSISRGGHSIIEKLLNAGVERPSDYIGFYNLRSYDRINNSSTRREAERRADVSYEDARRQHDDYVGSGYGDEGERTGRDRDGYRRYQREARRLDDDDDTPDTVTPSYMCRGPDLRDAPWSGSPADEMDAFVSEELYVHSKLLIADDRLVICGSANLNDRSQLGTHDSEIAVVIEDPETVDSRMDGEPFRASVFATSLRRQIFRKHLGLLRHQPPDRPDQNWEPVDRSPNDYDWGSEEDRMVEDPMCRYFTRLWSSTARENTDLFSRAFHPVPNDKVRTWRDYDEFFSRHFIIPGAEKKKKKKKSKDNGKSRSRGGGDDEEYDDYEEERGGRGGGNDENDDRNKVMYGHIVREEFPGGVEEVKEWLSRVRGNLVDMPLDFLVDVDDIAKEGLELNSLTQELYT